MIRLLFEKTGDAVWISHLDLMRLFQRAFKRAELPLKHTQGFSPRPSVSIALPLSVGVASHCELLDFELDGADVPCEQIVARLNATLTQGVRVLDAYDQPRKLKDLAFLDCKLVLEYDRGVASDAEDAIRALFSRPSLLVEKKSKKGDTVQDIIPMIRNVSLCADAHTVTINARICCQNPSLNPMQLCVAISKELPHLTPDFVSCTRLELYDTNESVFR